MRRRMQTITYCVHQSFFLIGPSYYGVLSADFWTAYVAVQSARKLREKMQVRALLPITMQQHGTQE